MHLSLEFRKEQKYRISGKLNITDKIMNRTFWIGLYPGLTEEMLEYSAEKIGSYLERHC